MSTTPHTIQSPRLDLRSMTVDFLAASLSGDYQSASKWLGISPPEEWMGRNQKSIWPQKRLEQLQADPSLQPWLMRAIILRVTGSMVGEITFHTAPNPEYLRDVAPGGIEIGYTIYPAFRQQGFATEAVAALMEWAEREHEISRFVLSISPDNKPSLRIAKRFGFHKVGSQIDEIDGPEDVFLLDTKAPHEVQSET